MTEAGSPARKTVIVTGASRGIGHVTAKTFLDRGWRIIEVRGPLDLAQVGVLAALSKPLADAGVSVFAVSTYDTDYLLVKEDVLEQALSVLSARGHRVE